MKLQELWHLLNDTERQELRTWVAAPQNKVREDAVRLLDYLAEKGTKAAAWEKETVFRYLYGEKKLNEDWLRHAQSILVKTIERFWTAQKADKNELYTAFLLAEKYHELRVDKFFQQNFRHLQHKIQHAKPQNAELFRHRLEAENLWFRHSTEKDREAEGNLQAVLDAQEKYFAAIQLRTICTAISYQNIQKKDFDYGLLTALLARIEEREWQTTEPAIGVYYFICKMNLAAEGEAYFLTLQQKLPQYAADLPRIEQQNAYLSAINYAIRRCNKGETAFFRRMFELYKEGIESGILLTDAQEISPYTYKNTVAVGLRIGEYDYTFSFLEKYKNALPDLQRKNYYDYNLARYYFFIRNFAKAKPILLQLDYGDIFLQLDGKVMLLKMYYEVEDYDALELFLRSFQQF